MLTDYILLGSCPPNGKGSVLLRCRFSLARAWFVIAPARGIATPAGVALTPPTLAPAPTWFVATATGVRALVDIAQGAAERFNLPLVAQFLAFGEFHEFQYVFHLIHRALQGVYDFHHFINGLADGRTMMSGFGVGGALDGDAFGQPLDPLEQRFWLGCMGRCGCRRSSRAGWAHGRLECGGLGLRRRVRLGGWWRLSCGQPGFGLPPAPTTTSAAMATTIAVGGLRRGNCGWTRYWCFALGHARRACEEQD
jgi:hypothetical protein